MPAAHAAARQLPPLVPCLPLCCPPNPSNAVQPFKRIAGYYPPPGAYPPHPPQVSCRPPASIAVCAASCSCLLLLALGLDTTALCCVQRPIPGQLLCVLAPGPECCSNHLFPAAASLALCRATPRPHLGTPTTGPIMGPTPPRPRKPSTSSSHRPTMLRRAAVLACEFGVG